MSPEQVRAERVDQRSDIFSFGTILYEMATGQRAFRANSSVETMIAILREEPSPLPPAGSKAAALDRVIRRCLEKNPLERFQSARDVTFALEDLLAAAPLPSITRASPAITPASRSVKMESRSRTSRAETEPVSGENASNRRGGSSTATRSAWALSR
jgi:eukaryotic-like serine/threonine-protein kinase